MEPFTMKVRGEEVTVKPSIHQPGSGPPSIHFQAEHHGKVFSGSDLEKLYGQIMTATKKAAARIAIPFTRVNLAGARTGTITGRHQGTGKMLVVWDEMDLLGNPLKEQLDSNHSTLLFRPLDVAEVAEYQHLLSEKRIIEKAVTAWESEHKLDVYGSGNVVDAEIEKAIR